MNAMQGATVAPNSPAITPFRAAVAPQEPLCDAIGSLRQAARLPFEAARPGEWADAFARHAVEARNAFLAHVLRAERTDSPIEDAVACQPHLRSLADRQAEEHRHLLGRCQELVESAQGLSTPGLWDMVELSERAKLLEKAVDRHHRRMLDLVYEANLREIGGEAG